MPTRLACWPTHSGLLLARADGALPSERKSAAWRLVSGVSGSGARRRVQEERVRCVHLDVHGPAAGAAGGGWSRPSQLKAAMGVHRRAARVPARCLHLGVLARLVLAEDRFDSADVSALFGSGSVEDESLAVGCQPGGLWGPSASASLYELPGAGTNAECQDIQGTRSVCSTPKLGSSGCEVLANTAGCTCHAFCEHHGLVCEASWDDLNKRCIKQTDDQLCELGTTEQICLCVPHAQPPLVSIAELIAIVSSIALVCALLVLWFYCHRNVPECQLWGSKRDEIDVRQPIYLTCCCLCVRDT